LHAPVKTTLADGLTVSMGSGVGREGGPRDPTVCPTDDEAIVPKRKLKKQSAEYIIKSGIAGGLAGCAVCFLECSWALSIADEIYRPKQ
jgi:hypothetical protein